MATLDALFYKEFTQTMQRLKGQGGAVNLQDIPLPPEAEGKFFIEKRDKVVITGIQEEYYSKLNGTEALLWGSKALQRRKFDYKGEFMRDKNGNYMLQDVPCPHECTAIISPLSIQVPTKFKSKEQSQYVDMVTKKTPAGDIHRFVYIIPKKYCYMLKQTALVLSWNKLRRFYQGVGLSLKNGSVLYMYVIPYKPTSTVHNYRVLQCKTSLDYDWEINILRDYWITNNFMFNPAWCQLDEPIKGRDNMAYVNLDSTEDIYERFDISKPLGEEETIEDVGFLNE
jgi:hypothetical protein